MDTSHIVHLIFGFVMGLLPLLIKAYWPKFESSDPCEAAMISEAIKNMDATTSEPPPLKQDKQCNLHTSCIQKQQDEAIQNSPSELKETL